MCTVRRGNSHEIYYINLLKPTLNCDDKVKDELTVKLPEVEWNEAHFKLWDKWKQEIKQQDGNFQNLHQRLMDIEEEKRILRSSRKLEQISEDEFHNKMDLYLKEQADINQKLYPKS